MPADLTSFQLALFRCEDTQDPSSLSSDCFHRAGLRWRAGESNSTRQAYETCITPGELLAKAWSARLALALLELPPRVRRPRGQDHVAGRPRVERGEPGFGIQTDPGSRPRNEALVHQSSRRRWDADASGPRARALYSTPSRTRTCALRVRSAALFSTKLWGREASRAGFEPAFPGGEPSVLGQLDERDRNETVREAGIAPASSILSRSRSTSELHAHRSG
jgi:hypothetical protein